jgi:hypothetical protein
LDEAEIVIGIGREFHKLPSEVLAEDASVLWYLDVVAKGKRETSG